MIASVDCSIEVSDGPLGYVDPTCVCKALAHEEKKLYGKQLFFLKSVK